jgi:regulatory protein
MRFSERIAPESRGDGVITSLTQKKGSCDRVAVYIDGLRAFDVAACVADQANLHAGDVLTTVAQEHLLREDAPYRARERALGLLARRDRSCHEMDERLRTAGFEPAVVAGTVAWLRDLDYLNDARFSAGYVSAKLKCGWGKRKIGSELLSKGVDRRLVDEALGADESSGDSAAEGMEAVMGLVRRRFGTQFQSDPEGAKRRVAGFLGRRGYGWDTIHAVTRILSDEAGEQSAIPHS